MGQAIHRPSRPHEVAALLREHVLQLPLQHLRITTQAKVLDLGHAGRCGAV